MAGEEGLSEEAIAAAHDENSLLDEKNFTFRATEANKDGPSEKGSRLRTEKAWQKARRLTEFLMPPYDRSKAEQTSHVKPPEKDSEQGKTQLEAFLAHVEHLDRTEAQMPIGILRNGDIIQMQYGPEGRRKGFTFEVTDLSWGDFGIGVASPSPLVVGRLSGDDIPSEILDRDTQFIGSGFGFSMVKNYYLNTGESPLFKILGEEREEFTTQPINTFEILRPDAEGRYSSLEPQQLEAQVNKNVLPLHRARLQQLNQLLTTFGVNLGSIKTFVEEKEGNIYGEDVEQLRQMTRHNDEKIAIVVEPYGIKKSDPIEGLRHDPDETVIKIYDKVANKLFSCLLSETADSLKIGLVDLNNGGYQKLDEAIDTWTSHRDSIDDATVDDPAIYRSDLPITTFTTSVRYGIAVTDYMVNPDDAREYWDIPIPKELSINDLHLQMWPSGQITVDPLSHLAYSQNEIAAKTQEILDTVSLDKSDDDSTVLHMNGRDVTLPNPETVLASIIQNSQS